MDEIARFLRSYPPFDRLPEQVVHQIAGELQIEFVRAGQTILTKGGEPSSFLYIVCKGSVDLLRSEDQVVDTLGPGEAFGHPSLIRGQPPLVTVRAHTDTLLYLLPGAIFHRLRAEQPQFAAFFAASVIERLGYALQSRQSESNPALFQTRLRDLVARPPVSISPEATVGDAARLMRDERISSLIVEHTPIGIITDRDLRNRVLAEGLPDTTPVRHVMSVPATTIAADALAFEGLLLMLERGIHHLPLVDGDRVVGVVTHTDILRRQSNSPLFLPRLLQRATSLADLRRYTDQVADAVFTLTAAGARVSDIGRVVAVAHDALLQRLIHDAEVQLGPPPVPYAWLVLGSEGRYEQTLRTDQDNALVYDDSASADNVRYFEQLATLVVDWLVECGFPRCPGNIMATNPEWRQSLATWQRYFHRWIEIPDEESLLRIAIFFDYRQVYGRLSAEPVLRTITQHAAEHRIFMARLARAALRQPAPLTFFRQVALERRGDQRDLLDLKLRGTAMVVDLARLFALEARSNETNTIARLRAAKAAGVLSHEDADNLISAFELLSSLRLHHQQKQIALGLPPDNLVNFHQLGPRERREVKESLQAIASVQRGVALMFQTDRLT